MSRPPFFSHEIRQIHLGQGFIDFPVGDVRLHHGEVLPDGGVEDIGIVADKAQMAVIALPGIAAEGRISRQHGTLLRLINAQKQAHDGGLAAAGFAHNGGHAGSGEVHGYIFEDLPAAVIGEGHVLHLVSAYRLALARAGLSPWAYSKVQVSRD